MTDLLTFLAYLARVHARTRRVAVLVPPEDVGWAPGAGRGRVSDLVPRAGLRVPRGPWRRGLLRWLLRWRSLASPTSARQLMEAGYPAGPALGEKLRELRSGCLDQERW